jgi:hypothetical protein
MIPPIHAVVVGIDKYPDFPHLTKAVSDARKISDHLKQELHADVTVLDDYKATKEEIIREISSLSSKTSRNDAILFYFSGYAGKTLVEQSEGSGLTEVGIICPIDVSDAGGISDKSLLQTFDQVSKSCGNNIVSGLCIRRS